MQGYNATVLAYGQTGSGKTHTMSGGTGIHGLPEEGGQQYMLECFVIETPFILFHQ